MTSLVKTIKKTSNQGAGNRVDMFEALRSTLEEIAASSVNGEESVALYTDFPRTIIDSGANLSFVQNQNKLSNISKHVRPLITAEG